MGSYVLLRSAQRSKDRLVPTRSGGGDTLLCSADRGMTLHSNQEGSLMEKATFGMGCFWGVEATFRAVKGVLDAAVGYAGGDFPNPTYKDVCTDTTGHAEVVEVQYDPAQVSYDELLNVFWQNHDPTTLNRQGPDWGKQYRSVIFYHT